MPEESATLIHRLDPRTKLILACAFTVTVFVVETPAVAAAQALFLVGISLLSRVPLASIFPHRKFMAFLLVTVVVVQMLFRHGTEDRQILGELLGDRFPLPTGIGSIGLEGLFAGIAIACRVMALAVLMPLLILTTEARLLAFGITKLGANYRVAHVITSTLNLVRSFEEEVALILDARSLRGAGISKGAGPFARFLSRLSQYRAVALPLMIKVMRRSFEIALVMDARAFGAYKTRTWLLTTRMAFADYVLLVLGAVYCAVVIVSDRILGG